MPNHIKNKIELIGNADEIKSLVEKYSTFFPSVPRTSYDGELIYKKSGDSFEFGWLNKETGVFKRRNQPDVVGVPEGYEQDFEEAFTRFPDFKKVFPVPKIIEEVGEIHDGIATAVKAKFHADVSTNPLVAALELMNRNKSEIMPQDKEKFDLACKAYEETGYCYWYDWQSAMWGTKWNAYSCEKLAENIFTFETAWSGVVGITKEISLNFSGTIEYKYADEDTGCNTGHLKISNGKAFAFYPDNSSKEAYDLAFELRPDRKEDYQLVGDKYEYVDSD